MSRILEISPNKIHKLKKNISKQEKIIILAVLKKQLKAR